MCIHYHIFCMYYLARQYVILNSSDILHDVTPFGSNAVYLTLYGHLWAYTTQCRILFHSTILL